MATNPSASLIAILIAAVLTPGCSMFDRGKPSRETESPILSENEFQDDWGDVGAEGRGDRPREKETDKLTPFFSSPQARAIEKNLGID